MTTIERTDYAAVRPQPRPGSAVLLPGFWRSFLRRWQERRTLVRLSRLAPHIIRDMGFDPDSIYDEIDGSWDEVNPGKFRNR